jgi:hypothetical protein
MGNVCDRCGRQIPESTTACDCGDQTPIAAHDAGAEETERVVGDGPPAPAMDAPTDGEHQIRLIASEPISDGSFPEEHAPTQDRSTPRTILMIAGGVLVGAAVTFAILAARAPSPEATVSQSAVSTPQPAASAAPKLTYKQTWNSANREWIGDHRNAAAFELLSETKVPIWQRQAQPILVVRCLSKRTEAFVFIESAAQIEPQDDRHTVRFRFDQGPEITERWTDSEEHDALFAPEGAAFAKKLARARALTFSYTPHNAPRVATEFHVSGLGDLIQPIAARCGGTDNH